MSSAATLARRRPSLPGAHADNPIARPLTTSTPFVLYIVFTVMTFLSVWNLIPALKPLRLTVLMLAAVSLSLFVNRPQLIGRMKSDISRKLFILLGYIVLSLPLVEWPGSVLRDGIDNFGKAIAFFFFTVLIIDTRRRLGIFTWVFVVCQMIRSLEPVRLHVMDGYWGSDTWIGDGEFMGRLASAPWDTLNPNGYAFIITTAFVFAHHLMLGSGRRLLQLVYLVCVPILMYGMILSSSRSGMIALVVAIIAIFVQSKKRTLMLVCGGIAVAVAVASMTELQKERYLSLFRSDVHGSATATGRVEGAKQEIRVWLAHPIFGTGLGTSAEAKYNVEGYHKISHNMYLEALIEFGVIGFVFFAAMLVAIWRTAQRALKEHSAAKQNTEPRDVFMVQLGKALQAWFPMCAVFSIAHYGVSEPHWYVFAGMTVAWSRLARLEQHEAAPQPSAAKLHAPASARQ